MIVLHLKQIYVTFSVEILIGNVKAIKNFTTMDTNNNKKKYLEVSSLKEKWFQNNTNN